MKKIAIALICLIVIVAAGGWFLFANLDHMVKVAVEKYGSEATQADVRLDSVQLALASGQGTLSGLSVGNPKGFSAAKAFYLGSINVQLDTGTIKGTGPIVINQITIDKPQVTYELLNNGSSNLQTIQNNTQTFAKSFQNGTAPEESSAPDTSNGKPARKIIIKSLSIQNGQVAISQELLQGKQMSVPLPAIHLTDIGQGSGGATAAQVAQQIISSISTAAAQAGVTELAKDKISGVLKAVPGSAIGGAAVDTVGDKLKGVFGQ